MRCCSMRLSGCSRCAPHSARGAPAAYRDLCRETPIPHALKLWGATSLIVGEPREGQLAFARLLASSPEDPVGRYLLAVSASLARDTLTARREEQVVQDWSDSGP